MTAQLRYCSALEYTILMFDYILLVMSLLFSLCFCWITLYCKLQPLWATNTVTKSIFLRRVLKYPDWFLCKQDFDLLKMIWQSKSDKKYQTNQIFLLFHWCAVLVETRNEIQFNHVGGWAIVLDLLSNDEVHYYDFMTLVYQHW